MGVTKEMWKCSSMFIDFSTFLYKRKVVVAKVVIVAVVVVVVVEEEEAESEIEVENAVESCRRRDIRNRRRRSKIMKSVAGLRVIRIAISTKGQCC